LTVDLEHIAELDPSIGAGGPDEQQVRLQRAMRRRQADRPARTERVRAGVVDVLDVRFFGDHAGEPPLELGHVRTGARQDVRKGRLLCGGTRPSSCDDGESDEQASGPDTGAHQLEPLIVRSAAARVKSGDCPQALAPAEIA
jgi:hypothetical protein